MAINVNSNETPSEDREASEVSTSEVPVNHMMDAIDDSDSDFDDISDSDDPNDRHYELLATQDIADNSGQQTAYYPHNYLVEWIDWDQYEQNQSQHSVQTIDAEPQDSTNRSDASEDNHPTDPSIEPVTDRQIQLNDDRINEIKTLMTGFELPKDNIPVWAQNMPDDQWKAFLSSKLSNE